MLMRNEEKKNILCFREKSLQSSSLKYPSPDLAQRPETSRWQSPPAAGAAAFQCRGPGVHLPFAYYSLLEGQKDLEIVGSLC